MKCTGIFIAGSFFVLFACKGFSQAMDAKGLTKEGAGLLNKKDYAGAIAKYKEALSADPDYATANYQLAFTLNVTSKGLDALPYLDRAEKSATASATIVTAAYELEGSIYDQHKQPQKAIESYKAGIKVNPAYQPLHYNLGLAYFRDHQYTEAETEAVEAIKLDNKHASSQRLYALVTFHQNKRAAALLGFCSFLILEPNTARSAEAYGNIQHILQGGALKPEPGEATAHHISADDNALNQAITKAVADVARRRYFVAADKLTEQLRAIFTAIGMLAEKQTGNDFFRIYMAAYFYKLAQTPDMPAFARLVSLSTPVSAQWAKINAGKMAALDNWIKTTERVF